MPSWIESQIHQGMTTDEVLTILGPPNDGMTDESWATFRASLRPETRGPMGTRFNMIHYDRDRPLWYRLCVTFDLCFLFSPIVLLGLVSMFNDHRVRRPVVSLFALSLCFSVAFAQDDRPGAQAIEQALDQTTSVRYIDQPLPRVLSDIAKKYAFSIKIDERVAEANPDSLRLPINIELQDVSLRSALRLLLREHQLEYINEGKRLFVTTSEYAESVHRKARYAIPDTVANEADAFIAAIGETILLDKSMGTASVDGNELVVKAPRDVLAIIRTLADKFQPTQDAAIDDEMAKSQAKIDQFLQQPAEMDFVLTPLHDAVQQISRKHDFPILIDGNALEQAGIDSGVPVTFELKGIEMRRTLRFLLNSCNLSYIVRDGYLTVTTREFADSQREFAIHTLPIGVEPHMVKLREMYIKRFP
ncbi:MAG: hypothetical protein WBD20_07590, partial [Pirellulaceae bacterium]